MYPSIVTYGAFVDIHKEVDAEPTNVLMTRKMVTTIFNDIDPLWRGRRNGTLD